MRSSKIYRLMDKPIPDLSAVRSDKCLYKKYPIRASNEICVEVNSKLLCHSYYWHYSPRPNGATEQIFLRAELVSKLKRIDRSLCSLGLCLLIQEGYRPISVQQFVQDVSVRNALKKENPGIGDAELANMIRMFAASPNGDINSAPPPHLTGGAVDLTLMCLETGLQIDMGKRAGLFNTAFPDALEKLTTSELDRARRFRRLLFWLASHEGVVTNPTEWWHLSWGDQMWAWMTRAPSAIYGAAANFDGFTTGS